MKATLYEKGAAVHVVMSPKEYDIFRSALLLMSWSGIGIEKDEEKIRLLESMKETMFEVKYMP